MTYPATLERLIHDADYVEEKEIVANTNLADFLQGLLSFSPPWLKFLYRVRVGFLALFGHQTGTPDFASGRSIRVPLRTGESFGMFQVEDSADNAHWIGVATEAHLSARIAVLRTPSSHDSSTYRVITVVHLHNPVGRIYFTTILPFHHLVVNAMMRSASQGQVAR